MRALALALLLCGCFGGGQDSNAPVPDAGMGEPEYIWVEGVRYDADVEIVVWNCTCTEHLNPTPGSLGYSETYSVEWCAVVDPIERVKRWEEIPCDMPEDLGGQWESRCVTCYSQCQKLKNDPCDTPGEL